MKKYEENGVEYRHEPTPEGWVEVDVYNPHSCPWDYYGNKHLIEMGNVLKAAGIEHQLLVTHRRKLHPMGSGPGGRVRFGDDMMPGIYRTAVAGKDVEAAYKALAAHQKAIHDWLHCGGSMPEALR